MDWNIWIFRHRFSMRRISHTGGAEMNVIVKIIVERFNEKNLNFLQLNFMIIRIR